MMNIGLETIVDDNKLSSSRWNAYLLFLVWPFFSLVYALINYRSSWAKNIVWFFSGFFGYTFVISSEGMDANRYRSSLIQLHSSDLSFKDFLSGVYSGTYGRGDYLEPTLRYLVSSFTDDYRILFAVFGLTMGYFYSRNIWFLLEQAGDRIKPFAIPFLMLFIFLVPFWLINGFRFWTAIHIFFYGVICLLYFNQRGKGILFCSLAILTHIAFIAPFCILLAHLILPKKRGLFLSIFLISVFFLRFELSFFANLIPASYLGPQSEIMGSYLSNEYAIKRSNEEENLNWYARYRYVPIFIYTIISSMVLLTFKRKHIKDKRWEEMYYFGLLFFSLTNVLNVIPSMARFFTLAYLFIFGAIFLMVQNEKITSLSQRLCFISFIFILLPVAIQIRISWDFLGPGTFLYSPLFAWYLENTYAFSDAYKEVLN